MTKTIKIDVKWDDDCANIESDHNNDFKVNIKNDLYHNMDPLFKLDFMSDMEEWVQQEVNRIHKDELNKEQSILYSYVMRTPKSSEQLEEEENDPELLKSRQKMAQEVHLKTQNKIGKIIRGGQENGRSE